VSGDALFLPDGDRFLPSDFARGPWSPDALHGGPVAALLARTVETVPAGETMHVARMTVELLRPVPVAPLTVSATVVRPGRKVQLVDVRLASDDRDLAWSRVLRIRRLDDAAEAVTLAHIAPGEAAPAPPNPDEVHRHSQPARSYRAFHSEGAEMRWAAGEFGAKGPATVWVRLAVPVVPDEVPSPLQRVAAAADFGNGISSVLDFDSHLFINPDLSVYLSRPAMGEWICLDARTTLGTPGVGLAQSVLWDAEGPIGRSIQSLLVEVRTPE
jgi:hypothetical protein